VAPAPALEEGPENLHITAGDPFASELPSVVAFDDGNIHRQRLSAWAQIAPKQERFGLVICPDFKNSCARLEQHTVLKWATFHEMAVI
jgi:hypothetical protein